MDRFPHPVFDHNLLHPRWTLERVNSWDTRISRWLSILLQSSADSRAGEIVRSNGYKERQYMAWEDVEIKLVNGGTRFEDLQAQATLLWEKGSK